MSQQFLGHALAVRAAPISVKRLAGEELVMFPREIAPALFDEILGFCRSGGFSPRITQEARQTQTIISLVSAGLGIASDFAGFSLIYKNATADRSSNIAAE